MVIKTIDLQRTPTSLEEVLALVSDDTEVWLMNGDTPVVRISPLSNIQTEKRVRRFEENARAIGEAIAQKGLSEEELMQVLEESRQEVFEEWYGKRPAD